MRKKRWRDKYIVTARFKKVFKNQEDTGMD
jgi:hypothetical protein